MKLVMQPDWWGMWQLKFADGYIIENSQIESTSALPINLPLVNLPEWSVRGWNLGNPPDWYPMKLLPSYWIPSCEWPDSPPWLMMFWYIIVCLLWKHQRSCSLQHHHLLAEVIDLELDFLFPNYVDSTTSSSILSYSFVRYVECHVPQVMESQGCKITWTQRVKCLHPMKYVSYCWVVVRIWRQAPLFPNLFLQIRKTLLSRQSTFLCCMVATSAMINNKHYAWFSGDSPPSFGWSAWGH